MPENAFGLFLSLYSFAALGYLAAALADAWRKRE